MLESANFMKLLPDSSKNRHNLQLRAGRGRARCHVALPQAELAGSQKNLPPPFAKPAAASLPRAVKAQASARVV
jgi:hypothetical protein